MSGAADSEEAAAAPPPRLDLSPVVPQHYCLQTDCESEIMDLRAAVREAASDRWRAVATAKLLREKLRDMRRLSVGQSGGAAAVDESRAVIRRAMETNPLFEGHTRFEDLASDAEAMLDERGNPTRRSLYLQAYAAHFEHHQSLDDLFQATCPLIGVALVAALLLAALRLFADWRRSYTPYSRHAMRSSGAVIAEHPGRTRTQCRKRCDRDRNCVAFAMPAAGPDHRPGQASQKCATYRRFSFDPVPYDHRLDVDPGAGWVTWTKHDMSYRGCPPQGCGDG